MAAIAKSTIATMLAATEIDRAVIFRLKLCRFEGGSFMGTVAKGLAFALSARAPIIGFSGFDIDGIRSFLCYGWVVHGNSIRVLIKYSNT
jgi:hypothetical protein